MSAADYQAQILRASHYIMYRTQITDSKFSLKLSHEEVKELLDILLGVRIGSKGKDDIQK